MSSNVSQNLTRRRMLKGAGAVALGTLAFPMISRAQDKPIKIGMPTMLSGRVAQLGISSRNALHDGSRRSSTPPAVSADARSRSSRATPRASPTKPPTTRAN